MTVGSCRATDLICYPSAGSSIALGGGSPLARVVGAHDRPPDAYSRDAGRRGIQKSPSLGSQRGRGRPPQAAARRAGLEFVEKLVTTKLDSVDMTERNASMLRLTPRPVIVVELAPGSSSCWSSSPSPSAWLTRARRPWHRPPAQAAARAALVSATSVVRKLTLVFNLGAR
jgi:hypothetical protein